MYKKILTLSLFIILLIPNILSAQITNDITLKPGFNFISFTNLITLNPSEFKALNASIEDIFLFSSSAGSFLSASEGTLSNLSAGKGYIVKSNASTDIKISFTGGAITSIDPINLKTGFNLVGFSQSSSTNTFVKLMTDNTIVKGCYKWSPTAGTFIQVIRNESGVITKIDGVDPAIKAGESYFINLYADSTLTYDNTTIALEPSAYNIPVTPALKVANPVITPNGGTYSSAQLITISCATEGASIYYTINNDSATLYGAPFSISKTSTIKATASKPGWNNADLVTANFSFTLGPELEITGSLPVSALSAPRSDINYSAVLGSKGCSISVVRSDAENTEMGTVTINSNTYKANIPITDSNYTALIIIKDNLGRILFRNVLGKAVTKSEIPASATKIIITDINIDATSTAMALLAREKNVEVSKITSVTATDFQNGIATKTSSIAAEISQHFSSTPTLISEVAKAVNTVSTASLSASVSTATVPINISTATELLSSFVKVIKDPSLQPIITQNKLATSITLSAEQKIDSTTTTIDPILKVDQPILSHNGNTFPFIQEIKMSSNTAGALIYYTLDGTVPSTSSLKYVEPVIINKTLTIKAIAVKSGMKNSNIVSESFIKSPQIPSISNAKAVEQTNGDVIVTWTTSFPIDVNAKVIINPFTYPAPDDPSELESQVKYSTSHSLTFPASKVPQYYSALLISYIVGEDGTHQELEIEGHKYAATPIIVGVDNFSSSQEITIRSINKDAIILYTIDGSTPSSSSNKYTGPIKIYETTTISAITVKSGINTSNFSSIKFNKKTTTDISDYFPIRYNDVLKYSTGYNTYDSKIITKEYVAGKEAYKIGSNDFYSYYSIDNNGLFLNGRSYVSYDSPIKISTKFPTLSEENVSYIKDNYGISSKVTSKLMGIGSYKVYAGTFNDVLYFTLTFETGGTKDTHYIYLAKNIGVILEWNGRFENQLISGTVNGLTFSPQKRQWAFLVYACSDHITGDLSDFLINQMYSFPDSGIENNSYVAYQLSPSYKYYSSNSIISYRLYLSQNKMVPAHRYYDSVKYGSAVNNGDPNHFSQFLNWSADVFPAEHYAIIFSGHGSGAFSSLKAPNKVIAYDDYPYDFIDLIELKNLLNNFKIKTSKNIDIFTFDACNMAMFEVAYQIKDYCNYIVASEATVIGQGIDMNIFGKKVSSLGSSALPLNVAKAFIDSYFEQPAIANNPYQDVTMSVIDTSYLEQTAEQLDNIASLIYSGNDYEFESFKRALVNAENYGSGYYGDTNNSYIDVFDFAKILDQSLYTGTLKNMAANFLLYKSHLIPYNFKKGYKYKNSNGISIFLPKNSSAWYNGNINWMQYEIMDYGQKHLWKAFITIWTRWLLQKGY